MKRKIFFIFELLLVFVVVAGLFVYGQINQHLDNVQTKELDLEKVQVNEDVVSTEAASGITNIALFGVDSRSETDSYSSANSDTIIIASVNNDAKELRMVSVYRDSYLVVGQNSSGVDDYEKCNAAFAYGGVEQAISMLNTNLDLSITEYVAVDFSALVTLIDELGGLDIGMTGAEVVHMNNYCVETSEVTGVDYEPIEYPGSDDVVKVYHLNGVQATSYARIRYIGLDFQRTERQRIVIQKIIQKAQQTDLATLTSIMDKVLPMVETSLAKDEIFTMGANVIGYDIGNTTGFPFDHYEATVGSKGSIVIPTTLESNVIKLHEFLFDDPSYQPSQTVVNRSEHIISDTGYGGDGTTTTTSSSQSSEETSTSGEESSDYYSSEDYSQDYTEDYTQDYTEDYSQDYTGDGSSYSYDDSYSEEEYYGEE